MANDFLAGMVGPILGLMVGFMILFLILIIAVYIYMALAVMKIAKKTNTANAWLAWIPIANLYLMTQVGGLPGWYTFGILLAFIPFIGGLLVAVLMAYIWWKIAEKLGRPGWWGILLVIPFVNLIMMGVLAWGASPAPAPKSKPKRKK
ncbi:hypothetical protein HYS31_07195 [Candidatus Woesearchaeota archaeon]|nr:hypothetical protein [Candidatus Woesearchaeota archaeon]